MCYEHNARIICVGTDVCTAQLDLIRPFFYGSQRVVSKRTDLESLR